jgi:hypothetical protein
MSISEYFIPFTRMGINLSGEKLFVRVQGHSLGRRKQRYGQEYQARGTLC